MMTGQLDTLQQHFYYQNRTALHCWEWGVGVMVVVGDKGGEREREGAEGSVLYTSCWIYVLLVSKLLARS